MTSPVDVGGSQYTILRTVDWSTKDEFIEFIIRHHAARNLSMICCKFWSWCVRLSKVMFGMGVWMMVQGAVKQINQVGFHTWPLSPGGLDTHLVSLASYFCAGVETGASQEMQENLLLFTNPFLATCSHARKEKRTASGRLTGSDMPITAHSCVTDRWQPSGAELVCHQRLSCSSFKSSGTAATPNGEIELIATVDTAKRRIFFSVFQSFVTNSSWPVTTE